MLPQALLGYLIQKKVKNHEGNNAQLFQKTKEATQKTVRLAGEKLKTAQS